jgi:hypothetical protein
LAALASQSANPALHAATAHFEEVQVSVAWSVLQARLQPPQFFASLVMLTSQPLAPLPSQSARPAAHVDTVQTWAVQTSDAALMLQTCPQDPQLFGSCAMSISQPFEAIVSQFWNPVAHDVTEQVAPAHDSTALVVLHGVAQSPQCFASVPRLTQAALTPPSGGQSAGVAACGQDIPQFVPSHVETPLAGMGHTLHDAPHELVDTLSRQVAADPTAQLWVPAGQTQLPPWQTIPPVQAWPQVPQLS